MIDVKQAAQAASNFIGGLYSEHTISDVLLEEVELSEDGKFWLITLSFPPPSNSRASFFSVGINNRQYKVFKVDADTGEVISMKIRELSDATS